MKVKHTVVLTFPPSQVTKPITYHLVKDYDLAFNIHRANVTAKEEGLLVLEITGDEEDYKNSRGGNILGSPESPQSPGPTPD